MTLLTPDALESHRLLDEIARDCVVQIDAVDFLRGFPDASVDLVVTDPAYESLEKHRAKGTTTRLKESDASSNPWFDIFYDREYPEFFGELYRVMKPKSHVYVFCDETTSDILKPIVREAGFYVWKTLIWVKTQKTANSVSNLIDVAFADAIRSASESIRTNRDGCLEIGTRSFSELLNQIGTARLADALTKTGMGYHWRASCERILFLEKRSKRQPWPHDPHRDPVGQGRRLNNLSMKDVMFGEPAGEGRDLNEGWWSDAIYGEPRSGDDVYPTEKPAEVVRKLIANSSSEGELVLDPFAGSGVVGHTARELGRHFALADISDRAISTILERMGTRREF